jgi:hypothetical protein
MCTLVFHFDQKYHWYFFSVTVFTAATPTAPEKEEATDHTCCELPKCNPNQTLHHPFGTGHWQQAKQHKIRLSSLFSLPYLELQAAS